MVLTFSVQLLPDIHQYIGQDIIIQGLEKIIGNLVFSEHWRAYSNSLVDDGKNDHCPGKGFINIFGKPQAIHFRHPDVRDNEIKAPLLQPVHGLLSIAGNAVTEKKGRLQ